MLARRKTWKSFATDCNPLEYHFWDKIELKVYGDENELKKKIRKVWREMSNPNDLSET